jgi:predicted  nucleic acid-binding Zn-ribbon protein
MQYIPYIISFLSLLLAGYSFLSQNNKENTSELTTVIVKLENIGNGISDIKSELAHLKDDQKEDHDKLIKVETSVATMWKRYDELKASINANI